MKFLKSTVFGNGNSDSESDGDSEQHTSPTLLNALKQDKDKLGQMASTTKQKKKSTRI